MCDINSAEEIQQHDLYDLRHSSSKAIGQLGEDLREVLLLSNVFLSIVRMRATLILSSMKSKPHCGHVPELQYELAYVSTWWETARAVFQARWWINEYSAGVYFIYDEDEKLKYIGSSCGGALGNRIYDKSHESYRHAVDVVLFDRKWCHLALAFEALAISRLRSRHKLKNKQFMTLWIPPFPPYDQIWSQP